MPMGFPIIMCGYVTRCDGSKITFSNWTTIDLSVKPFDICCHRQGLAEVTRLSAVIMWKTAKNVLASLHCQKESWRECDEKRKKVRERKKDKETKRDTERQRQRVRERETEREGRRDIVFWEKNDKNKQTETREGDRVVEEMGRWMKAEWNQGV